MKTKARTNEINRARAQGSRARAELRNFTSIRIWQKGYVMRVFWTQKIRVLGAAVSEVALEVAAILLPDLDHDLRDYLCSRLGLALQ